MSFKAPINKKPKNKLLSDMLEKCCRVENTWINEPDQHTDHSIQAQIASIDQCTIKIKKTIKSMSKMISQCSYNVCKTNYNQTKNQKNNTSFVQHIEQIMFMYNDHTHAIEKLSEKFDSKNSNLIINDLWDHCCCLFLDCQILYFFFFYSLDNRSITNIEKCFDLLCKFMMDNYKLLNRFRTHMFLVHSYYEDYDLWLFENGMDRCVIHFKYFTDQLFYYLVTRKKWHRLFFQLMFIIHFESNIKSNDTKTSFEILRFINNNQTSLKYSNDDSCYSFSNTKVPCVQPIETKKRNKSRTIKDKREMFGTNGIENVNNILYVMNDLYQEIERENDLQPDPKKRKHNPKIYIDEQERSILLNEPVVKETEKKKSEACVSIESYFIQEFECFVKSINLLSIFDLCISQITNYRSSNSSSSKIIYICNYLYHVCEYACFIDLQKPTRTNKNKKTFEECDKNILDHVNQKYKMNLNMSDESISNCYKRINNFIKEDQYMIQQTSDNLKWILKNWVKSSKRLKLN